MKKETLWIEKIFDYSPKSYPIFLFALGAFIFLIFIYFVFILKVTSIYFPPLDFFIAAGIYGFSPRLFSPIFINLVSSILVPFQIGLIIFLLKKIKYNINNLKFDSDKVRNEFYENIIDHLAGSFWRFIVIVLLIVPAFILLIMRIALGESIYNFENVFILANIYMFFQHILEFIIFYLFGLTMWIIINIYRCLNILHNEPYRTCIKIDIINIDNLGGFGYFKNLILIGSIYYSFAISLAIFTFYRLEGPIVLSIGGIESSFSYESIYLLILLFFGFIFFLVSLDKIRKLLTYKLAIEMNLMNDLYEKYYNLMVRTISEQQDLFGKVDLTSVRTAMDILYDQKNKFLSINFNVFDLKSLISFSSTFILPILIKYLESKIFS